MTAIQQQAIQLIKRLPDAKIQAIITLIADDADMMDLQRNAENNNKTSAFARLEELDLNLPDDFNADKEYENAIGEKYGFAD